MKQTYLKSFCARCLTLLVLALLSTNLAWGKTVTVTLDKLGASIGSTSNESVATVDITATGTSDKYTLNYLQGKKQGDAILLAKSKGAFISNKTPIPGNIKSVTVYINSGASSSTTYHCAFSTTECIDAYTTGSTAVNIIGGNSNKYTCSVSNAKYFCVSLGNANNGQVLKLEIQYDDGQGADPVLQSIAISGTPTKTTYEAGEEFDPAGLVVTGTYDVGEPQVITEGITWNVTPSGALEVGTTSVSVTATVSEITSPAYVVNGLTVTPALPKITITADQVADFANSYKEYTWTASDVSGKLFACKSNGMQFNTNQTGYYVYNTDPIPGNIRSIKMTTHSNGTEREWKVSVGTTQIKAISGDAGTEPTKKVEKAGTTWTITGSNQYFCLVDKSGASNISEIVISYEETAPDTREMPTASFENETVNAVVEDNFTITVTTNSDGAVTYSSSDDDVATVDSSTGEVHAISAGTATITANIAGTATYKPASASYTIVIASAPLTGKGTEAEPYTVGDIIALGSNGNECWVGGTIVGYGVSEQQPDKSYKLNYTTDTEKFSPSNFVISDGNGHIAAVELPSGSDIRTALNLPEHLNYIGAPIKVYGKLASYFNQVGIKSTSNYKLTQQNVTISSVGWATACLPFNATISGNATAYYVTGTDGSTLVKIAASIIPAGEGVLLKSNADGEATVTFTISAKDADAATGNMMKGAITETTFNESGYKYYILANGGNGLGFYYQGADNTTGSSVDCAAGKAVLAIPTSSSAKAFISLDNEPTEIESIQSSTLNPQSSIYNLQGVRVNPSTGSGQAYKAYKGIVIMNGKKYINK